MKYIKLLLELGKVKITFAVSLTTITGYLLAKGSFDTGLILPTLGIFLLACGSSALNHFQEKDKDMLMERTRKRPIPSGQISSAEALLIALLFSVAGSYLIYLGSGFLAMQLGILALIWYNGVYTPLKRRTAFAVVPGSLIGAIPPAVGWVAGGGSMNSPELYIVLFFFFIWQVPHFWLLLLKYGREYEKAGFPSITAIYNEKQIKNITFIWTFSTAIVAMMLAVFGVVESLVIRAGIVLASVWLILVFSKLLINRNRTFLPFYFFMRINYFVLIMIILLSVGAVI